MCSVVTNPKIETLTQLEEAWQHLSEIETDLEELSEEYSFNGYTYEIGTGTTELWRAFEELYDIVKTENDSPNWWKHMGGIAYD